VDHGAAIIVFNADLVVVARSVGTMENFVSIDLECAEERTMTLISVLIKNLICTLSTESPLPFTLMRWIPSTSRLHLRS